MTVGPTFKPPTRFIFAYEYSPKCVELMKRVAQSDLLKLLQCHLVYVGDHPQILDDPKNYLTNAGRCGDGIPLWRCFGKYSGLSTRAWYPVNRTGGI
jgi:hypothetical protein